MILSISVITVLFLVLKLLKDNGFYDIQLKKDFRLKNRMVKGIKK